MVGISEAAEQHPVITDYIYLLLSILLYHIQYYE